MKRVLYILLAFCMLISAVGCNGQQPATTAPAGTDASGAAAPTEKIKIGISLSNFSNEYTAILIDGIEQAMQDYAAETEVLLVDGQADAMTQLGQIDTFISSGCDVIVLEPIEKDALTPGVEAANAAGIPIILTSTKTSGGEFIYVGDSDIEAGRIMGEWVAENAPENAKFLYLLIVMGQSGQIDRKAGMMEVLEEKRPDIEMITEQSGNGQRDQGMKIMEDWLQTYDDFDMVLSQCDAMALGAIEAMQAANRMDGIIVTGMDATDEALQKIQSGELSMTIFKDAYTMAYTAFETALQVGQGTFTGGNEVMIPLQLITAENVDEYL